MTRVRFGQLDDTRWMQVDGHAGYAPEGQDIVCAGVSITAQSLAATLCQTDDVLCDVKKAKGSMYVVCRCSGRVKRYVDALFDMARTSFELLAEEYPDHVKVC